MGRRFGLIANCQREAATQAAVQIATRLKAAGKTVVAAPPLAALAGAEEVPEQRLGEVDILVACGGDGTLLAANRLASPTRTPVLGVHAGGPGSFGFLAETNPEQAGEAIDQVLAGEYMLDERLMASADVWQGDLLRATCHGLNDIVLRSQLRMLKMAVKAGSTALTTYAADGIIVATPTGSTAYNLAAGGPLVHPAVACLLVTPICPHTLNVRSLLVAPEDTITVTMEGIQSDPALLIADGQQTYTLAPGDRVVFRRSELRATFVSLGGTGFYARVHSRLRLGERF